MFWFALPCTWDTLFSSLSLSSTTYFFPASAVNTPIQLKDNVSWVLFHQCEFVPIVTSWENPSTHQPRPLSKCSSNIIFLILLAENIFFPIKSLISFFLFFHSFTHSTILTEHLLCAQHFCKNSKHISKQNRSNFFLSLGLHSSGNREKVK